MVQTTGKTVVTKKTASPPKALSTIKKAATKPVTAKAAAKPVAQPASKATLKKPTKAATATKGNGELLTPKKTTKSTRVSGAVTPEQRYCMICDAAYFRAEQRGFVGGSAEQDWREAEIEIDQKLCAVQGQQQNH